MLFGDPDAGVMGYAHYMNHTFTTATSFRAPLGKNVRVPILRLKTRLGVRMYM